MTADAPLGEGPARRGGDERGVVSRAADAFEAQVATTIDRAVPDRAAVAMARHLAARAGVVAVLLYGNRLRDPRAGGLLDFYVLTAGDAAYHGRGIAALANRLLPPNVYHEEITAPVPTAAKVAVMRLASFRHRMRRASWDTTLWARFAQPVALLHARDDAVRAEVVAALAEARRTAAWWADRLPGAAHGESGARWRRLFEHTFAAELRVEGRTRAGVIVDAARDHYAALDRLLEPPSAPPSTVTAAWRRRRRVGKALNAARLVKAAFTFRGGPAYAVDKLARHAAPRFSRRERRRSRATAPRLLFRRRRLDRRR